MHNGDDPRDKDVAAWQDVIGPLRKRYDDWGAFLLLEVAVPRALEDLRRKGGPDESDWLWAHAWAKDKLCPHGESLLYRITDRQAKKEGYDTATMFAELARMLAILSFLPGGSRFGEMRWEVVA